MTYTEMRPRVIAAIGQLRPDLIGVSLRSVRRQDRRKALWMQSLGAYPHGYTLSALGVVWWLQ